MAAGNPCWECAPGAATRRMVTEKQQRVARSHARHGSNPLPTCDAQMPKTPAMVWSGPSAAACSRTWGTPLSGPLRRLSFSRRHRGSRVAEESPWLDPGITQAAHRKATTYQFGAVLLLVLNLVTWGLPAAQAVNILYPDGAEMANVGVISVPQGPFVLLSFSGRFENVKAMPFAFCPFCSHHHFTCLNSLFLMLLQPSS